MHTHTHTLFKKKTDDGFLSFLTGAPLNMYLHCLKMTPEYEVMNLRINVRLNSLQL